MKKLIARWFRGVAEQLEKRKWRGPLFRDAAKMFAKEWIITPVEAAGIWGQPRPRGVHVRYELETVRRCEDEKRHLQEWYFAYLFDFSLREMYEFLNGGAASDGFESDRWWLDEAEDSWADERIEAGGYLINLCGHHENMTWQGQEREVHACRGVVRVPSAALAQLLFTLRFLRRKCALEYWCHWGPEEDSKGHQVCEGPFGKKGLKIWSANPASKDSHRAVCYMKRWDF